MGLTYLHLPESLKFSYPTRRVDAGASAEMHEYLLYSQIPAAREAQILNILSGVTSAQPAQVSEQVVLYAQTRAPDPPALKRNKPKQQQQQQQQQQSQKRSEPIYHKLIRSDKAGPWLLRAEHTPEPGLTAYISRQVTERPIVDEDVIRLQDPEWYRFRQQYAVSGNLFVHHNVIVKVLRFLIPSSSVQSDPFNSAPLEPGGLTLLDQSGSCVVEASIRVDDASNSTITDQAKNELLAFQAYMDGALDLFAPDRLCLDTRVKDI